MGFINYCANCGARLLAADFEKNGAIEWNGRTYCKLHVPGAARPDAVQSASIKPARPSTGTQPTSGIRPSSGSRPISSVGETTGDKRTSGRARSQSGLRPRPATTISGRGTSSKTSARIPDASGATESTDRMAHAAAAFQSANIGQNRGMPMPLLIVLGLIVATAIGLALMAVLGTPQSPSRPAQPPSSSSTPSSSGTQTPVRPATEENRDTVAASTPATHLDSPARREWLGELSALQADYLAVNRRPQEDADARKEQSGREWERAKRLLDEQNLPADLTAAMRADAQRVIEGWRDRYADACAELTEKRAHEIRSVKLLDAVIFSMSVVAGYRTDVFPRVLCDQSVPAYQRLVLMRDRLRAEIEAQWAGHAQRLPTEHRQMHANLLSTLRELLDYQAKPRMITPEHWAEGVRLVEKLLLFQQAHQAVLADPTGRPLPGPLWETWYLGIDSAFGELWHMLRLEFIALEFSTDFDARREFLTRLDWWTTTMIFRRTVRFGLAMSYQLRSGQIPSSQPTATDARIVERREALAALLRSPEAGLMEVFVGLARLDLVRERYQASVAVELETVRVMAQAADRLAQMWLAAFQADPDSPTVAAQWHLICHRIYSRRQSPVAAPAFAATEHFMPTTAMLGALVEIFQRELQGHALGDEVFDALLMYGLLSIEAYSDIEQRIAQTALPVPADLRKTAAALLDLFVPALQGLQTVEPVSHRHAMRLWRWCQHIAVSLRAIPIVENWAGLREIYYQRSEVLLAQFSTLPRE